eukprot:1094812-Heterocapsa_arctica.AAC.1
MSYALQVELVASPINCCFPSRWFKKCWQRSRSSLGFTLGWCHLLTRLGSGIPDNNPLARVGQFISKS